MRRFLFGLLAFAVVAAFALYVGSPYLAFYQLERAAKAGDRDGLEDAVDFPAVREDFKAQLNALLLAKAQNDPGLKGNPLAAIGLLLVPAILDRLIDAYVTPQGIAQMVTEARAPRPGEHPAGRSSDHVSSHDSYVSLDRFKVAMAEDSHPDRPLTFVMARRGLFGWKLIRIELPPAAFRS